MAGADIFDVGTPVTALSAMQWLMAVAGILVVGSAIMAAMGFRGREQIVGIDLGTTFSVVALRRGNEVTVLPDRFSGKKLVPSVVSYQGFRPSVGTDAVLYRSTHPLHTIFNAKRFIGRPMDEVHGDAKGHPFNVVANVSDPGNESALAGFLIPGQNGREDKWVSPIDVGAEIVKHMKLSIAASVGFAIHRAVICVPAKFSARETKATVAAFEAGGIKVMRVLEEPTAAAIAYNLHKGTGVRHVLVYDIGGGTLDTSLLFMNGKSVSVLGVAGDEFLGGSDFDRTMRSLLERKLASETDEVMEADLIKDPSLNRPKIYPCDSSNLFVLAEAAKIELTNNTDTAVHCLSSDSKVRQINVSRAEFEDAADDLFARAMAPVAKVLEDQMMTIDHVDDVVLVGGASRMPKIRSLLRGMFGDSHRIHTEIDPDVTVAWGAANIVD